VQAEDRDRAEKHLRTTHFDVLISDVTRGSDKEAGYADLEWLKREGLFDGRAIFYVNRITPARRRRADALGASVINTPAELMRELVNIAEVMEELRYREARYGGTSNA
jgi:hypothetical protein